MDQTAILRDYKELRRLSVAVNTRLAEMLGEREIKAAASALGVRHGNRLELQTEDEISVVMDYAIHNVFRDGLNAVQRLLDEKPPAEGSNELRLLRAMQDSHYSIFDVQTPIRGFGVRGLDGPEKIPITIADIGFGESAAPGLVLAARIFSPGEGWWMTTGAALPLHADAADRILRAFENHQSRYAAEPTEQERTTMIIRACIASGASHYISYATPGKEPASPVVTPISRGQPKIGRNDPCPCGSGKKYKKCCGSGE